MVSPQTPTKRREKDYKIVYEFLYQCKTLKSENVSQTIQLCNWKESTTLD